MKIIILLSCILINTSWSKTCYTKTDHHPGHHHLLYYLKHANFSLNPFRGPNCKTEYRPQVKPLEFAQ